MRKQERLVQQLLRATESMVQGGLSETSCRCGNPNCICQRDPQCLHGPHLYITYRVDGKSHALHVPPKHAKTGRRAKRAWAAFLEDRLFPGCPEPRTTTTTVATGKEDAGASLCQGSLP